MRRARGARARIRLSVGSLLHPTFPKVSSTTYTEVPTLESLLMKNSRSKLRYGRREGILSLSPVQLRVADANFTSNSGNIRGDARFSELRGRCRTSVRRALQRSQERYELSSRISLGEFASTVLRQTLLTRNFADRCSPLLVLHCVYRGQYSRRRFGSSLAQCRTPMETDRQWKPPAEKGKKGTGRQSSKLLWNIGQSQKPRFAIARNERQ